MPKHHVFVYRQIKDFQSCNQSQIDYIYNIVQKLKNSNKK